VNTLENKEIQITATELGFYINSSNGVNFNSFPIQPIQQAYTLVGLLCQVSHLFKENFTKLMTQVITADPILFIPSSKNKYDWLKPHENTDYYNYRHKIHDALFVLQENSKPQREWNEELQAVYDLKIPNSIENLQKEKLLASLYNSFKESAVEVIIDIIIIIQ